MSSIHLQHTCWLSSFLTSPFNYSAFGYFTGARAYSGQAGNSFATSVNVCRTTICHIPDDSILHSSNLYLYNIRLLKYVFQFLGAFAKLRKATIFVMSVRLYVCASVHPPVHMQQLGFYWTDYHEIWYVSIFRKSVQKIQVSSQSNKNNGYCTWRPMYFYDNISFSSS
jgi:hypothetical protein